MSDKNESNQTSPLPNSTSGGASNPAACSASPPRMEVIRGDVIMADHSDLDLYLMDWQKRNGVPDFTSIRILTDEQYQELRSAASMAGIA